MIPHARRTLLTSGERGGVPIVVADEPQTSKPRRRWPFWLAVSLGAACLAVLVAIVIVPFFRPIRIERPGQVLWVVGMLVSGANSEDPQGVTSISAAEPDLEITVLTVRVGNVIYLVETTRYRDEREP